MLDGEEAREDGTRKTETRADGAKKLPQARIRPAAPGKGVEPARRTPPSVGEGPTGTEAKVARTEAKATGTETKATGTEPKAASTETKATGTEPRATSTETKATEPKTASSGSAAPDAATPTGQASGPDAAQEAAAAAGSTTATLVGPAVPTALGSFRRRYRARFAHALRRTKVSTAIVSWARRPSGRLALPAMLLVLVVSGTGAAGALLVPATGDRPTATGTVDPSSTGQPPADVTMAPTFPPQIGGSLGPTGAPMTQRPADTLRAWAAPLASRLNVPAVAMEAYGYAELVVARTSPTCGLKWTTLAAIGQVESGHGSANGATLLADGRSNPTILGPQLNGTNDTQKIADTDRGVLDGDQKFDRAVGPMQFIPTTWETHEVDADNDGMRDPGDIDDAALAAANYLCAGGRKLTQVSDWWAAILAYNNVPSYARSVYQIANDYGTKSRT